MNTFYGHGEVFNWGINPTRRRTYRDKLDRRAPPSDNADKPFIFKFNTSMIPVVMLSVSANESWEKLEKITDRKIVDALKRIPGVATALQIGGDKRGVLVNLDRERVQATGLSGSQIVGLLRNQNVDNPGGTIKQGSSVSRPHPASSPARQRSGSVVVATKPGVVRLGTSPRSRTISSKISTFYIGGSPHRHHGSETVRRQHRGRRRRRARGPSGDRASSPDVKLEMIMDTSEFIQSTIDNLSDSVLLGGIAVFFVILFFLRDIRGSLIICTTIPTSLIITFLLMYMAGYTLNQISLSSLAIAIGMVVDNSIVILDNIKRYLTMSSLAKAISGAVEMGTSVMASTLTTIVIFLPIIFTTGLTNIMFGQLAMIITMALSASLISALMLTPMMCSKILKPAKVQGNTVAKARFEFLERIENLYGKALGLLLSHRWKTVGGLMVCYAFRLRETRRCRFHARSGPWPHHKLECPWAPGSR